MKFGTLDRRLQKIEPAPSDLAEKEEIENDWLLVEGWKPHFMKRLTEQGLGDLIPEMEEALQKIGPRPFGHSRPDDYAVWNCIDEVSNLHHEHVYRIRAADSLAWADVLIELGAAEDDKQVVHWREFAAEDIEREKKNRQTTCDRCGGDLHGENMYTWSRDGRSLKICRTCSLSACGLWRRPDDV